MASTAVPLHLDRKAFDKPYEVTALKIPKRKCADAMRLLKGFTISLPRIRCVLDDVNDPDYKLLLLDHNIRPGTLTGLPDALQKAIKDEAFNVSTHQIILGYSHVSADEALKKLLPVGVEVPTSFETVGHIAHYNLREEHNPYKHIIGQVTLDKNPALKTVVTKKGEIENEFRVFDMEVIAGEPNLVTEVNQHGHRFKLDYSTVFWNSRLENEHRRLVAEHFLPGDVVADVMAGIGPFVIPAAKSGCTVYSNDLNPESTRWLRQNIKLNKVADKVTSFCVDGRDFIKLLCATPGGPADDFEAFAASTSGREGGIAAVPEGWKPPQGGVLWQHAVMNLPRTAVDFCDAFHGAFDEGTWHGRLPLVHCYTFQKDETIADVIQRIETRLGGKLEEAPTVHKVRDVAPNKYHICVTFRIPEKVAFTRSDDVPEPKRQKL